MSEPNRVKLTIFTSEKKSNDFRSHDVEVSVRNQLRKILNCSEPRRLREDSGEFRFSIHHFYHSSGKLCCVLRDEKDGNATEFKDFRFSFSRRSNLDSLELRHRVKINTRATRTCTRSYDMEGCGRHQAERCDVCFSEFFLLYYNLLLLLSAEAI